MRVVDQWLNDNHPTGSKEKNEFASVLHQLSEEDSRSKAFQIIDHMRYCPVGLKDDNRFCLTRRSLVNWYQFVYQSSLSASLGVYLIGVDMSKNSYEQIAVENARNDEQEGAEMHEPSSLSFSGSMTAKLGEMPHAQFSEFCYKSRGAVARWRNCGPEDSLIQQRRCARDIAYCVERESAQRDRTEEKLAVLHSLIATIVLALVSVLLDNLVFTHGFPLVGIIFVAWLIAVVPNIIQAWSWWFSDSTTLRSIVFQNA